MNNSKHVYPLATVICGFISPLLFNIPSWAGSISIQPSSTSLKIIPQVPLDFLRNPRPQENIDTEKLIRATFKLIKTPKRD
jgi:hypothetical protein